MNKTQGVFPLICFVHSMIAFLTALTLKKVCTLLGLYCPTAIILIFLARLSLWRTWYFQVMNGLCVISVTSHSRQESSERRAFNKGNASDANDDYCCVTRLLLCDKKSLHPKGANFFKSVYLDVSKVRCKHV